MNEPRELKLLRELKDAPPVNASQRAVVKANLGADDVNQAALAYFDPSSLLSGIVTSQSSVARGVDRAAVVNNLIRPPNRILSSDSVHDIREVRGVDICCKVSDCESRTYFSPKKTHV